MAGSLPNFHKMDSRSACIQGVLKVKIKVKGHVIRALSWILGMSYSVIDGLVSKKMTERIDFTRLKLKDIAFRVHTSEVDRTTGRHLPYGNTVLPATRHKCTSPA